MGSGPQGTLTLESSIAGPRCHDSSGPCQETQRRIKWKEIAGALRRKKKLKQASQESVDISLTFLLILNMSARDTLGGEGWGDLPCPQDIHRGRKTNGADHSR